MKRCHQNVRLSTYRVECIGYKMETVRGNLLTPYIYIETSMLSSTMCFVFTMKHCNSVLCFIFNNTFSSLRYRRDALLIVLKFGNTVMVGIHLRLQDTSRMASRVVLELKKH